MPQLKVVISAGGQFAPRASGDGTVEYQGGETKLVPLLAGASYQDLLDTVAMRSSVAGGSITSASSAGHGLVGGGCAGSG